MTNEADTAALRRENYARARADGWSDVVAEHAALTLPAGVAQSFEAVARIVRRTLVTECEAGALREL